jgi:retron-type reverse transcriptase
VASLVGKLKAMPLLRKMRRHGNLWQEIISSENIQTAYKKSILGKSKRRNVKRFNKNKETKLEEIQKSLIEKTFTTSKYIEKTIYEPKKRIIYVLPFAPDRIVQHALMNIVEPIWEKLFISDSYACIIGKGIHKGSNRTMQYIRRNKYCLKCDVSKFYPSVDQEILFNIIKKKIKCPDTLWLTGDIIHSYPGGKNVPIGNYTSQWFGNLYLNELDNFVKVNLQARYGHIDYIRYCDDFCLYHDDKKNLHDCAKRIQEFLREKLLLKLSKCDVFPVTRGVDFLGYRHFDNYILLRKSTMKRVRRRMLRLPLKYAQGRITAEQFRSSVGSTWGWLKHANSHNLMVNMDFERLNREVKKLV